MPRYPRIFLPNIPLHVVQRGHDRQPIFIEGSDYEYYLENLMEMKTTLGIQVHAYCLMTNHVHLIIAPDNNAENVSKFIRVLAARQTRYVNKLENRSGTLWDGRFKASLIDSDRYLLACYRYVELNPVRASMVALPEQYEWSSYHHHSGASYEEWLDDSAIYAGLGDTRADRSNAYRAFVAEGTSERELCLIRTAAQRNQVTGTDQFRHQLEQRIGRRISTVGPGRPKMKK